ncbi:MAG TPA: hypothetical protein ACFCUD_09660 [Cyclobacteriaceae bacterium]
MEAFIIFIFILKIIVFGITTLAVIKMTKKKKTPFDFYALINNQEYLGNKSDAKLKKGRSFLMKSTYRVK